MDRCVSPWVNLVIMLVRTVYDGINNTGDILNDRLKHFDDIIILDNVRTEIIESVESISDFINKSEAGLRCVFESEIVSFLHHFFMFLTKQGVPAIDGHQHTIFNAFLCASAIN
jgi:hypothetical protein